jgi:hypothetical protein
MVAVIGAGFGFGVGLGVGLVGGLLESPPHDHAVIPSASAPATKLIARVFMSPLKGNKSARTAHRVSCRFRARMREEDRLRLYEHRKRLRKAKMFSGIA